MVRDVHDADLCEAISLTVPWPDGTGSSRWETLWNVSQQDTHRIVLGMWGDQLRTAWIAHLEEAIRKAPSPVIICAHSLGCLAVAWWARDARKGADMPVAGAFLVAPPDLSKPFLQEEFADFAPLPRQALPFPSIVIAGEDSKWIDLHEAAAVAADWNSHFIRVGPTEHLPASNTVGWWERGKQLLDDAMVRSGSRRGCKSVKSIISVNASEAVWAKLLGLS